MSTLDQLIENPPEMCENLRDLWNWSTNYDEATGTPLLLFMDLIGESEERFGEKVNPRKFELDFESGWALGQALQDWAMRPQVVVGYLSALIEAEAE
jgi:hypothetical protein